MDCIYTSFLLSGLDYANISMFFVSYYLYWSYTRSLTLSFCWVSINPVLRSSHIIVSMFFRYIIEWFYITSFSWRLIYPEGFSFIPYGEPIFQSMTIFMSGNLSYILSLAFEFCSQAWFVGAVSANDRHY